MAHFFIVDNSDHPHDYNLQEIPSDKVPLHKDKMKIVEVDDDLFNEYNRAVERSNEADDELMEIVVNISVKARVD